MSTRPKLRARDFHIPFDGTPGPLNAITDVPGVWVAGNVTDLSAQVVSAAAGGVVAAAAINADLIAEETRQAVSAYLDHRSAAPRPVSASVS